MDWVRVVVVGLLLALVSGVAIAPEMAVAATRTRHAKPAAKKSDAASQQQQAQDQSQNADQAKDTSGQTFITYSQKEKDPWDKAGVVAEYLAALAGLGVVVVGALLLTRISKQTEAAAEAASAAQLHAESLAATERAWLLIGPARGEQDWSREGAFHWVIRNVGKTPARLMETQARCQVMTAGAEIPERPFYGDAVFLHDRMLAPGDEIRLSTYWGVETERGYEPVENAAAMPRFALLAYGSVTYLDVFDREHESRFCEEYVFDGAGDRVLRFAPRLDASPEYTMHR
ncbi:hypothetical protein ACFPT7_10775 [Acidicapsa dinghuensis]|uniref:DUF4178 domain-containing protein n=1 Tax=Acidicapsa dinghuensis TaxID=2218256 RepID=A0ABW1EF90_9BACT|nr:hypothetical protein [Acidicapsa dinghuensis]